MKWCHKENKLKEINQIDPIKKLGEKKEDGKQETTRPTKQTVNEIHGHITNNIQAVHEENGNRQKKQSNDNIEEVDEAC